MAEKSALSTRKLAEKYQVDKTQITVLLQQKEGVKKIYQLNKTEKLTIYINQFLDL